VIDMFSGQWYHPLLSLARSSGYKRLYLPTGILSYNFPFLTFFGKNQLSLFPFPLRESLPPRTRSASEGGTTFSITPGSDISRLSRAPYRPRTQLLLPHGSVHGRSSSVSAVLEKSGFPLRPSDFCRRATPPFHPGSGLLFKNVFFFSLSLSP